MGDFKLEPFLMSMAAVVVCITVHEFAHAYSAYRSGDDTPRLQGRISLNPIDHLDPIGTLMIVASSLYHVGFGWGKPVQINPYNFRHPRWDNLKTSLWGPLSNILTAAVTGTVLRFFAPAMSQNVLVFVWILTIASIGLAVFNLLPIYPLDGSHIASALLPYEAARRYDYFMGRYGFLILLGLLFLWPGALWSILDPPRLALARLFTGLRV
jgi:Zn-dependent protease